MVMAKGKATVGTIALGAKSVKIVLEISKKDFFKNAKFFEGLSEEVDFSLGDNQMNMADYIDEDEEAAQEDERRKAWLLAQRPGISGKLDANGLVEMVNQGTGQEELQDMELESDLDPDLNDNEDDLEPDETGQEAPKTVQNEVEIVQETGQTGQQSDGSDDADLINAIENEPKGESAPSDKKIELEDIENYIMENSPKFENIEYDFAAILLRKKESNETWREIANSMGISSGVITAAYSEVKKRVKKILEEQTGAA